MTLRKINRSVMRPSKGPLRDGAFIARLLNQAAKEPLLRDRYKPLEQVALQLRSIIQECSRKKKLWATQRSSQEIVRSRAEGEEALERFNAMLRPHTWHLQLASGLNRKGELVFFDMPTLGGDANLMFRLVQIARAGLLDRLRKCAECGIWFFSRTPWGQFCSTPCRKKKNRSTPEAKEHNAKYNRKYYREKVSPHQEYYMKGMTPAEVKESLKRRKNRLREKKNGKRR